MHLLLLLLLFEPLCHSISLMSSLLTLLERLVHVAFDMPPKLLRKLLAKTWPPPQVTLAALQQPTPQTFSMFWLTLWRLAFKWTASITFRARCVKTLPLSRASLHTKSIDSTPRSFLALPTQLAAIGCWRHSTTPNQRQLTTWDLGFGKRVPNWDTFKYDNCLLLFVFFKNVTKTHNKCLIFYFYLDCSSRSTFEISFDHCPISSRRLSTIVWFRQSTPSNCWSHQWRIWWRW